MSSKTDNLEGPNRTKKAREFRKEQVFKIVNEFQRSMQMIKMVQTLDSVKAFFDSHTILSQSDEIAGFYSSETIEQIKTFLIALDKLNSRTFSAKMFRE